jgi:hypothetical protein
MTGCPDLSLKLRLQLIDMLPERRFHFRFERDAPREIVAGLGRLFEPQPQPPSSAGGDFRGSPPTFCAKFQTIYA